MAIRAVQDSGLTNRAVIKPSPSSPIGCSAEPSRARAARMGHRASRTEHARHRAKPSGGPEFARFARFARCLLRCSVCHTQMRSGAHSCALYVCYMHDQPIRSQQCTGRQGQHGATPQRLRSATTP